MRASKYICLSLLIDAHEMHSLIDHLGISAHCFLQAYSEYIAMLKRGEVPERSPQFLTSWTLEDVEEPIVRLKPHALVQSSVDGSWRSSVSGIAWGLQFCYPQIVQDEETFEVTKVDKRFPNTELFWKIRRWIRTHTLPVTIDGQRLSVRLGRACFDWINQHPQLEGRHVS